MTFEFSQNEQQSIVKYCWHVWTTSPDITDEADWVHRLERCCVHDSSLMIGGNLCSSLAQSASEIEMSGTHSSTFMFCSYSVTFL